MPRRRRSRQPGEGSQSNQPQEDNSPSQNAQPQQKNSPRSDRRPRKNNQPRRSSTAQGAQQEQTNPQPQGSQPRSDRRPRRNNQPRRNGPFGQNTQPSGGVQKPDANGAEKPQTEQPSGTTPQDSQQRGYTRRGNRSSTNQPRSSDQEGGREQSGQFRARRPQGNRPDNRQRDRRMGTGSSSQAASLPIPTNKGIKARSQRGMFSRNWWARRWIEAMEQLVDPARLQRGRSYARQGQVLSIEESQLGVEALVQGSRPQPYKVTIQLTPLTDDQWNLVIDALSEQAIFTAKLLAGEMPENIEDAFNTARVSLFPDQSGDLFTSCSCPDWANPCKHVAATHYILGDRFDDDPFLLFRMRGRDQDYILQALRSRRAGDADTDQQVEEDTPEIDETVPLIDLISHFWEPVEPLDSFPLTIRPPTTDMPLLKRMSEPAFLGGGSLQEILKPVYDTFTRSALRAAYSEEEPLETNNGHESENE